MKRVKAYILTFIILVFFTANMAHLHGKESITAINKYKKLTPDRLLKIADNFSKSNVMDSALMCYSLIYNNPVQENDTASARIVCQALNHGALVYFNNCDYKTSLELLLKALSICEKYNDEDYLWRIYNNIGNIHYSFNEYKVAKKYYKLAYDSGKAGVPLAVIFNNLGMIEFLHKDIDSALMFFRQSYRVKLATKDSLFHDQLNNIGLVHYDSKRFDSAFVYYRAALNNAQEFRVEDKVAKLLLNIASLHFETKNYDSAIYYLEKSNLVAEKRNFLGVLSKNLLYFSMIEEAKGNASGALNYYKQYSAIKDSIFDASKYGNINDLQFRYDMVKVDNQIKQLNLEQEMKERTIEMQRMLQLFMGLILLIVIVFLILIYKKNKTLDRAYVGLVNKNIEIVNSDRENQRLKLKYIEIIKEKDAIINKIKERTSDSFKVANLEGELTEGEDTKYKASRLKDASKGDLMNAILEVMDDKKIFCDIDFSLDKLADIIGSNSTYVSQIINESFKKNFSAFLNDYRIRESRRMLSDIKYEKYSIESISTMVGFKSKSTFNARFKEIIGVTPSFYVKSLKGE